jgi:hypothetical protein
VAGAVLASRHNQKAGRAKSNHARLSSSSIDKRLYAGVLPGESFGLQKLVFQKFRIQVNVTSVFLAGWMQERRGSLILMSLLL